MNRRLTLIIDGNWLLMSRLAVITGKNIPIEKLTSDLKILMLRSINLVLKTFHNIDSIVFVSDGGSWRNNVSVPSFLEESGIAYKGNRTHDYDIDIDKVFEAYNEFTNVLKENGIAVCYDRGVEGDDWCYYVSKMLNDNGTNCIIWSKDKDLTQLVRKNENGTFTVFWNKENGLIAQKSNADELDLLMKCFTPDCKDNDDLFVSITKKCQNTEFVNPSDIVIEKIMRGDAGDNIQPIIVKKPTSARIYKISSKHIDYGIDIYDDAAVKEMIHSICEMKQYVSRLDDRTENQIFEHFKYNRNLVSLDARSIPQETMKRMESNMPKIEEFNSKSIAKIEQEILAKNNGLSDLLDTI